MDITRMSPAQIVALREQGIAHIARAAGRRPGVVHQVPGGLPAVHEVVRRSQRDPFWQKLLAAVAFEESKGDQYAVSLTGALGPLQLTASVYGPRSGYGEINPFQWGPALRRAHAVLHKHFHRAARGEGRSGTEPLLFALGAYNQGWRGAHRESTWPIGWDYALRVLRYFEELGGKL